MTKHTDNPREQQQRDDQQAQQDALKNQQRAETDEVLGRQKDEGPNSHQGGDKGRRGQ